MSDERTTHVLTVRQPYAWAIIFGGKDVENRSWKPRKPCRILIHAGLVLEPEGIDYLRGLGVKRIPKTFPGGYIIGAVDMLGAVDDSPSKFAISGAWHWRLTHPIPAIPAIPAVGRASFFRPPADWQDSFPGLPR